MSFFSLYNPKNLLLRPAHTRRTCHSGCPFLPTSTSIGNAGVKDGSLLDHMSSPHHAPSFFPNPTTSLQRSSSPKIHFFTTFILTMAFLRILFFLLRLLPTSLCFFQIMRCKRVHQEMCLHLRANPLSSAHGLYDLVDSSIVAQVRYHRVAEPQSQTLFHLRL